MKKKVFIFLLAFALAATVVGCGSKDEAPSDKDTKPGVEDSVTDDDLTEGEEAPDSGSTTEGAVDNGGNSGTNDSNGSSSDAVKPEKPSGGNTASKPGGSSNAPSANKPGSSNSGNSSSNAALSGKPEDIIAGLYKTAGLSDLSTGFTAINKENMQYYLGVNDLKIKQGVGSEPLMSSVAHSVVLIELEAGQDVSKVKSSIKKNVDGFKWVCVGVEDENILVDNIGNFVLLVMDEDAQSIMDAFKALAK